MSKLYVYYFPDKQLSYKGEYETFSGSGSSNWDLGDNDKFCGTRDELKTIITNLFNKISDYESEKEPNYIAISNLTKVLAECPWKNGYITIDNTF